MDLAVFFFGFPDVFMCPGCHSSVFTIFYIRVCACFVMFLSPNMRLCTPVYMYNIDENTVNIVHCRKSTTIYN